jgi:hypothetical protein
MKRSVGIAMQVGFGNLGGVLSGFTYTGKDAPQYRHGHTIVIGLLAMSTVLCFFMRWWCGVENERREAEDQRTGKMLGWSKEQKVAEREKGDSAGFYRYTL